MKLLSIRIFSLCCFISLILLISCDQKDTFQFISSTTPNHEQLKTSAFHQFISDLNNSQPIKRNQLVQKFLNDNPNSPIVENDSLVCFYWYGMAASVLFEGDIPAAWTNPDTMKFISCGESSFFYKAYTLPANARIDYRFILDSTVTTDPRNSSITPSAWGNHSECAMPKFKTKSIRKFRSSISRGNLDSLLFNSNMTSVQSRMIKIYTPPNYESLTDIPTIYVNDGFKAIDYCSYLNILDNLIEDKKIIPIIAVFIEYKNNDQIFFLENTDEYIKAICDELVPKIDSIYKTSRSPNNRAITGISAGGNLSLLTPLVRPDKFLKAAGQSTTITETLLESIESLSGNNKIQNSFKFYFDVGRYDLLSSRINGYPFLYSNQLLHRVMERVKINHLFNVHNDGHQWANWRERIDEILIYLFST
jgi:enterochelin esterase-like enzyme